MSASYRCAALLAICCLMLSPALAAAAEPNQLGSGSVSPGSGTTQTTFLLSVSYSSERDFSATSVVALVAGRSIQLRLVSGSASAGTYQGSASLPAGRWPVTFEAQATQGPTASAAGPTVVVNAPPTPQPVPVVTPAPPPLAPAPPGPAAPPPPAPPPQAPQPTAPIPSEMDRSPASSPTPATSARPDPGGDASEPPMSAGSSPGGPAHSAIPGVAGGLSAPGTSGETGSPLTWLIIIGSGAAAALLLLVWWRRRGEDEEAHSDDVAPVADPHPISLAGRAAMRRSQDAQGVQSEDPILAAMGVGAGSDIRPQPEAPLTRRVTFGPGERPAAGARRNRGAR